MGVAWTLTEKDRRRVAGLVVVVEHFVLVPLSLLLLFVAWYLVRRVDDSLKLIEDMPTAPLPVLLIVTGVLNVLSNYLLLKSMAFLYRPSTRFSALKLTCVSLLFLLTTTVLLVATALYCFIQWGRLPTLSEKGLTSNLKRYLGDDHGVKGRLDLMQMSYECCGDQGYTDWFQIPWIDPDVLMVPPLPKLIKIFPPAADEKAPFSIPYTNDDTPFSCCLPSSPRPCVHHHVTTDHLHYDYSHLRTLTLHPGGCRQALLAFMGLRVLCPLGLCLLFTFFLQMTIILMCRLAQTSMQNAIGSGKPREPAEAYIFTSKADEPPDTCEGDEKWALLSNPEEDAWEGEALVANAQPVGGGGEVGAGGGAGGAGGLEEPPRGHWRYPQQEEEGFAYGGEPVYANVLPEGPHDYLAVVEGQQPLHERLEHNPLPRGSLVRRTFPTVKGRAPSPAPFKHLPRFPSEMASLRQPVEDDVLPANEAPPYASGRRKSKAFTSLGISLPP